jgi:hypothetical protein
MSAIDDEARGRLTEAIPSYLPIATEVRYYQEKNNAMGRSSDGSHRESDVGRRRIGLGS